MKYIFPEERYGSHCLECGDSLTYGRRDRKFCCPQCKNRFHNRLRRVESELRSDVTAHLNTNYQILSWLLRCRRRNATLEELLLMGFDANYFTFSRKAGCHMEYRCYDIAYFMTGRKVFHLWRVPYENQVNGYICKEEKRKKDER